MRRELELFAIILLALPANAQVVAPRYRVTEVGNLGGSPEVGTNAYDVNNLGEVVGYSSTPGPTQAYIWQSGQMTRLESADSTATTVAFGINDAGAVVGVQNDERGFIWVDGALTLLPKLKGGNRSWLSRFRITATSLGLPLTPRSPATASGP